MSELRLRARDRGCRPESFEGGLRLRNDVEWVVEGRSPEARAAVAESLPARVVDAVGGVLLLRFGNLVGRFRVPGFGALDVRAGRWGEAMYQAMLRDVVAQAAALPFTVGETGSLPYDRVLTDDPRVLYHAFVYLRHVLGPEVSGAESLTTALRLIQADPHRLLRTEHRCVPLPHAARVSFASLADLAAGRRALRVAPPGPAGIPLARALGGRLPETVDEERVLTTYDTPENRFVRRFLRTALSVVDRIRALGEQASERGRFWRRTLADCEAMRWPLHRALEAPLFDEVGEMVHLPAASTVLQRRRGYREVYRHFLRLRAASRLPLGEASTESLLEGRDIADLYELWCFFAVVEAVSKALGARPIRAVHEATDLHVQVGRGMRVTWPGGVWCAYNLTFGPGDVSACRSYSLRLRPDVTLRVPRGPHRGHHFFDAKLRARTDGAREVFRPDDLYKMHTYRDALADARSAWVLYPGEERRYFPAGDGPLDGVGVLPLRPGGDAEALEATVAGMLGEAVEPAARRPTGAGHREGPEEAGAGSGGGRLP